MAKHTSRIVPLSAKQIRERDACLSCPLDECVEVTGVGRERCLLSASAQYRKQWREKKRVQQGKEKTKTWTAVRPAVLADYLKLDQRARAFIKRHDLKGLNLDVFVVVGLEVWFKKNPPDATRLRRLWRRVVRRALNDNRVEGIRDGQVGFYT